VKSVTYDSRLKTQDSRFKTTVSYVSRFTFYVLRFTFHVLRFTFHVLRFTFHVLRFTFHVSRFTFHVSRFTFHVLCFTFYILCFVSHVLCFVSSSVVAEDSTPLRVLDAEGEEIASLEVSEIREAKYVPLGQISKLFSGTRKREPLIGRITMTMMGKRIVLTLGQHQLKIDGEEYVLSNPPTSISDKVFVPLDFLTEILPNVIGKQITLDREDWTLQLSREPFAKEDNLGADSQVLPQPDLAEFRVIVDPGHGGYDVGAKSKAGLLESDLTFVIAQRTKELLATKEGVAVYLTRSADDYKTIAERVNFANKLRGHVYLSIHFNWSPIQRCRGFRIYVNSNRMRLGKGSDLEADMFSRTEPATAELPEAKRFLPQSKQLAREIADRLRGMGLEGEQEKECFLAVMDGLSMPGVLVEVLYLSNPQDLTILNSRPDFIDSVSQSFCDSILAIRSALEDKSNLASTR
jgi:N-acetylmuramoyl-L-alanine amidase